MFKILQLIYKLIEKLETHEANDFYLFKVTNTHKVSLQQFIFLMVKPLKLTRTLSPLFLRLSTTNAL